MAVGAMTTLYICISFFYHGTKSVEVLFDRDAAFRHDGSLCHYLVGAFNAIFCNWLGKVIYVFHAYYISAAKLRIYLDMSKKMTCFL